VRALEIAPIALRDDLVVGDEARASGDDPPLAMPPTTGNPGACSFDAREEVAPERCTDRRHIDENAVGRAGRTSSRPSKTPCSSSSAYVSVKDGR